MTPSKDRCYREHPAGSPLDVWTAMEFRVLGPLDVMCGEAAVTIGSPQQRRLLAVLLVHAGTVVSADRLVDELWGERPPATALQSLWTCVARLRRALAATAGTGRHSVLVTRAPGYLLQVGPDQVDAGRFERLVADACRVAPDRPQAAVEAFDEALLLWRGPAFAEFADAHFASAERARLDELRLTAIERRFDAELALGRHAESVGALQRLAAEHPLRERTRAQLMLALYRWGGRRRRWRPTRPIGACSTTSWGWSHRACCARGRARSCGSRPSWAGHHRPPTATAGRGRPVTAYPSRSRVSSAASRTSQRCSPTSPNPGW